MLKTILKLNGAQELSKADQKAINGGGGPGLPTCSDYCAVGDFSQKDCYWMNHCDCPGTCHHNGECIPW